MMKFRELRGTDLKLSVLSMGGASLSGREGGYGFGPMDDPQGLIELSLEAGINVFDTAPIYGFGESERQLSKGLKAHREKVIVVSKSGVTWHPNRRVDMTNDPKVTERMLHQSLKDLRSDYIDIYMIHWPDKNVDIRRPLEILEKAQNLGKIKHIGLCNTNLDDLKKSKDVCEIKMVQSELNLFNQQDSKLFDYLHAQDIGFMSWGTLDKGILSGKTKVDSSFDQTDCRSWAPWWKKSNKNQRIRHFEKFSSQIKKRDLEPIDLALHFNLSLNALTTAICGFKSKEQLDGLLLSLDKEVPMDFIQEAKEYFSCL